MKAKIFIGISMLLVCSALLAACEFGPTQSAPDGPRKIKIVTTLFPLYDMARHVGGDDVDVFLLLPPGVEAHSFDPKPSDIVKINEADVFVYTGKFMEPWAVDLIKSVSNKNLTVVDASLGVSMSGSSDPHIWLDFDNAKIMLKNIASAIEEKVLSEKNIQEANADEYVAKLTQIDSEYRTALASCRTHEIVYGGHYALGYLAKRYGLQYSAAQGLSPDAEPTAKDLVKLVGQINADKIKYIFYEELTSPKIAQTIADETHAQMLPLNAAHNISRDQFEGGITFFDIMKVNLDNLKIGLECR